MTDTTNDRVVPRYDDPSPGTPAQVPPPAYDLSGNPTWPKENVQVSFDAANPQYYATTADISGSSTITDGTYEWVKMPDGSWAKSDLTAKEDDDVWASFSRLMIDQDGVDYKYNEGDLLDELREYIDKTYSEHYVGHDNAQVMDLIISAGSGTAYTTGNIGKYALRYGKKQGKNRKDLLKAAHYAILALYCHDLENKQEG